MNNLTLKSLLSYELESKGETLESWQPNKVDNASILLDLAMEIGFEGEGGTNIFYVMLVDFDTLNNQKPNEFDKSKTIIISEYDFDVVSEKVYEILRKCSRNTWEESCAELRKYFFWEYDNYKGKP